MGFFILFFILGDRRLEVCGHGLGSLLPVAVLRGLRGRHGHHHPAGAVALRHHPTHRHQILQNRPEEAQTQEHGSRFCVHLIDLRRQRHYKKTKFHKLSGSLKLEKNKKNKKLKLNKRNLLMNEN